MTSHPYQQLRFEGFTKELAELSKKYGVTIQSTGGVEFWEQDRKGEELYDLKYIADASSGDLMFEFTELEDEVK